QATLGVTVTLTRGGQPVTAGPTVRLQGALATADFPLNREATSGNFTGSVPAGAYTAVVDDALSNPSKVEFSGVTVAAGGRNAFSFDLAPVAAVNLTVSGAGPAGGFVTVTVANPPKLEQAGGRPFIALATSDSKIGDYLNWEYPPAEGNTVRLRTPDQPGKLEARYYVSQADGTTRLLGKSAAFETSTPKATVTAPASVQAGSRFEVAYANPSAASDDYLALVLEGDEGNLLSYEYVNADSKAVFNAPGKPGNYLIVYKLAQGESIARSGRVTVTPASATVTAPASVQAGQAFTVTYSGPESERNYIALYREGENQYLKYEYLNPNRSVSFNAPGEPGNYVAAFVLGEGDTVVARSGRISVTAARATVTAPATVTAGSKFTVRFSGPKNEGDFIGLHREGESSYLTWVYVTGEDSVEFTAPTQTGNYVMVYHLKEGEQAIATSARVTVTAATASVRAPASVKAGAEFTVTWTGPANQGDYVAISPENEPDADLDFDYVEAGKEVRLRAPEEPGNYIVLYALQDGTIIARVKVTVTR
ncbi:MAG TPA: hypothetical protein VNT60_02935, partial [Deinococcales bacterium]|nr:hypothetical protein [Deinococcales bacterium]